MRFAVAEVLAASARPDLALKGSCQNDAQRCEALSKEAMRQISSSFRSGKPSVSVPEAAKDGAMPQPSRKRLNRIDF
jgi:hypothetical protein